MKSKSIPRDCKPRCKDWPAAFFGARWILETSPKTNEDQVFQLLGFSEVKADKSIIENSAKALIAKQKAEEAAKRKKLDALIGGVSNSNGTATGGEGNDNAAGDKGKVTGDPNAGGYYGNGGNGSGGDYQLGNRKPISRPKPDYICDEEGVVVVSIEVDTNGNVTKATPGVKGSTNTASCLMSQAKEAALKTKWSSDSKAPSKQVGTIKYRFSLSQ